MINVDLGDLKRESRALAEFLRSKLQASVKINGKVLVIGDSKTPTKARDVKMHLKRFLHHRGFSKEYRVMVNHQLVRVLKVDSHKRPKTRREEGAVPHPADTMPWYYPWKK